MIGPQTAALAISVARGVVQFGKRLDLLWVEKTAEREMILLHPPTRRLASLQDVVAGLRQLVREASRGAAPVSPSDLREIQQILDANVPMGPATTRAYELFGKHFPEQAKVEIFHPDREFLQRLRQMKPDLDWDNPDIQAAFLTISAGKRDGEIGYAGRVGLLIADVVAEVAAENVGLLSRHKETSQLISSILQRFAQPNLEEFDRWKPLLEHALRATLAGVLDQKEAVQGSNRWVGAVLDAVADARDKMGPSGDNFVLGLINGKGFPLLVGLIAKEVGEELDGRHAEAWRRVAGNVLVQTGRQLQRNSSFDTFFKEHWADILGAMLTAMKRHGARIFRGQRPVAEEVVKAIILQLAQNSNRMLLSRETLISLVNVAITTAAGNSARYTRGIDELWLQTLVADVLTTMAAQRMEGVLTKAGTQKILSHALKTLDDHPELLIEQPGIVQQIVGGVLSGVGNLETFSAERLAAAAAEGALSALSENPGLMKTRFAPIISSFTDDLADLVAQRNLSGLEAEKIAGLAIAAIASNPEVFAAHDKSVALAITRSVVQAAESCHFAELGGTERARAVTDLFELFARNGHKLLAGHTTAAEFETAMTAIVSVGLAKARAELGRHVSLSEVSEVVYEVAKAFADGRLTRETAAGADIETLIAA